MMATVSSSWSRRDGVNTVITARHQWASFGGFWIFLQWEEKGPQIQQKRSGGWTMTSVFSLPAVWASSLQVHKRMLFPEDIFFMGFYNTYYNFSYVFSSLFTYYSLWRLEVLPKYSQEWEFPSLFVISNGKFTSHLEIFIKVVTFASKGKMSGADIIWAFR